MRPRLVEKVWGGSRLHHHCGKEGRATPIGEAWEVADLEEGQSTVASGPYEGVTLGELVSKWGVALVGETGGRFPLLVKLLDARRDLSVQVHPSHEDVDGVVLGARSKWETWLIVRAAPGATVIHGLKRPVHREVFKKAAIEGRLEDHLRRVEVQAGDTITVAPGTIHAIGADVVLLEIQEPSDTTYRVYDYQRPGLDGELRQLHLEEALKVGRLGPSETIFEAPYSLGRWRQRVAMTPAYSIERFRGRGRSTMGWHNGGDRPQVVHVLEGTMGLADGRGGELRLEAFETAVIPAGMDRVEARIVEGPAEVVGAVAGKAEVFAELDVLGSKTTTAVG